MRKMKATLVGKAPQNSQVHKPPLMLAAVQAGFPSFAENTVERSLSLDDLIIREPDATFFVRAEGDSMHNAGIHSGDILVVDRSREPREGSIVIAAVDGEFTVKRLRRKQGHMMLAAENEAYTDIELSDESDAVVWGVVIASVKQFE